LENVVKFQCPHCSGILIADYGDEAVMCGHCEGACEVPQEFGPGVVIDDFLMESLLGSGGMGNVYIAYQFSLDRQVALKILHPQFLEDEKFQIDFINEARSVASLNHLNIVQAYKVGTENGVLFFAMELVEGLDLSSVLKREGSIIESYAIDIAIDTANALGYAWNKSRLVHRDIKPENIMIASDGTCKVMDLGLSLRGDVNTDEDDDTIAGTPQYISPEQVLGTDVDIRSDFYCLGATLFHLITGRFVFEADNLADMVHMHVETPATPLKELVPEITGQFNHIVAKLLAKKQEDRYQDSESLVSDLEKAKKALSKAYKPKKSISLNTRAIPKSSAKRPSKKGTDAKRATKKKKSPVALIVAGIIVILIISAGVLSSISPAKSTPGKKQETTKVTPPEIKTLPLKNPKELFEDSRGYINIPALQCLSYKDGATEDIKWTIEKNSIISSTEGQDFKAERGASVIYKFTAKKGALYHFWLGGILSKNGSKSPLYLKINGKFAQNPFEGLEERLIGTWAWTKLAIKENLVDGVNELEVITKAPEVKILHFILTTDEYFFPNTDKTPGIPIIEPAPPQKKAPVKRANSPAPNKTFVEKDGLIQIRANQFYLTSSPKNEVKWVVSEDQNSVSSQSISKPTKETKTASIKYSLNTQSAGKYNLWILIKNPSTKPIFGIKINGKAYNRAFKGVKFDKEGLVWIKSPMKLSLNSGNNTISISSRYNHLTLGKFILTQDDDFKVGTHSFKESPKLSAK
jgi:serine/threonine protein kinase